MSDFPLERIASRGQLGSSFADVKAYMYVSCGVIEGG